MYQASGGEDANFLENISGGLLPSLTYYVAVVCHFLGIGNCKSNNVATKDEHDAFTRNVSVTGLGGSPWR